MKQELNLENEKSDSEFSNIDENVSDSEQDEALKDPDNIYTKPTQSTLEYLDYVRGLPFHQRLFRKFKQGSLRGTIITWVRMTVGIGIFAIPHYIKNYGVLMGVFVLTIAALFNYYTFKLIFDVVLHSNKTTYIGNVRKLLGSPYY